MDNLFFILLTTRLQIIIRHSCELFFFWVERIGASSQSVSSEGEQTKIPLYFPVPAHDHSRT